MARIARGEVCWAPLFKSIPGVGAVRAGAAGEKDARASLIRARVLTKRPAGPRGHAILRAFCGWAVYSRCDARLVGNVAQR